MKTLAAADIPVHKVDNPAFRKFFDKYLTPSVTLPSSSMVRKQLPIIEQEMFTKIKNRLAGKKVAVLADESSDTQHRYFFQILLLELNVFTECKPFLAETVFLDEANHKAVAQAILKALNKYGIEYENVLAYGSDNVTYMKKSFTDILCNILTNARHVTCNAHIQSLIGECFRENMVQVDSLIASIKFIFAKALHRRRRYISFLKSRCVLKPRMPPQPVVVRWNTWFNAVIYAEKHYEPLSAFVDAELASENSTQALVRLRDLFSDNKFKAEVKYSVNFLTNSGHYLKNEYF